MEISGRRAQEFATSLANRQTRRDRVRPAEPPARAPWIATRMGEGQTERQTTGRETSMARVVREVKTILIVDPNAGSLVVAQNPLRLVADVDACSEFQDARDRLLSKAPDLLVTNLRLRAYNGLHLVHLATGMPTRCVVYAEFHDLALAREVQAAGAFYERAKRLLRALPAYVHAGLPPRDRRSPAGLDRRQILRGGRRRTDRFSDDVEQFL